MSEWSVLVKDLNFNIDKIKKKKKEAKKLIHDYHNKNYELQKKNKELFSKMEDLEHKNNEISQKYEKLKHENERIKSGFIAESHNILSFQLFLQINKIIEDHFKDLPGVPKKRWTLCYRATRDGFSSTSFHKLCDNSNCPTLVLIKSKNGSIFGGCTTKNWQTTASCFVQDDHAFLISVYNPLHSGRGIVKIPIAKSEHAIYNHKDFGPVFGAGHDISFYHSFFFPHFFNFFSHFLFAEIFGESNSNYNSYSQLGATYTGGLKYNSNDAQTFFCGAYNFLVTEIEVYSLL